MSSESETELDATPPSMRAEAKNAKKNLFPAKSKARYLKVYDNFMDWRKNNNATSFSESVFLAYFSEMGKIYKPTTLWAVYSMLKCTIHAKYDIELSSYRNLISYIKRQSDGFKSQKSKILTSTQIKQFLNEAPDCQYLATKVALILGINGACRSIELYNITTKDVERHDNIVIINLCDNKTKIYRTFVVRDECLILKKYQDLRPVDATSDRFFLSFRNGKCTKKVIGQHKLGAMPKEIATYLKLPNLECYNGHCFRRSSATLLADSGASLCILKKHGGWKSDRVPEGYIEDSVENKKHVNQEIGDGLKQNESDFCFEVPLITEESCLVDELTDLPTPSCSYQNVLIKDEPNESVGVICINQFDESFVKEETEMI